MNVRQRALEAKAAARILARQSRARKDAALDAIARGLLAERASIESANDDDVRRARQAGLSSALVERLVLSGDRVAALAQAVLHVAGLPDPVGSRGPMQRLQNGLLVGKQRLPLGLIAIVYESRPNVTVDAAALTLKSGNAVLLRGGKEAASTNAVLVDIMRRALGDRDLPEASVSFVPPGDREEIRELCGLTDLVDLAIPRGGEGLIRFVTEVARVPVIKHYKGVCHLYLDESAELEMALPLTLNAKVHRPGVCNALECLLVHHLAAPRLLPEIARALSAEGVELRACERARALVPTAHAATAEDFGAEFLDKILAIRVVDDLDAALLHVERYGSNHTEAICTNQHDHAERWLAEVDASCVVVNASTRFNDGGELGLGAEMGISTSKLHAYGPMGLESLTSEKWIVLGQGQVRS
ncbi:MAG: glutamate-5-semialdehyde dehydrogenase [Myxococcales bacterium]|nr:glutamate-5-semialdehyde dehydrogenase [Myxococcales bacterium]